MLLAIILYVLIFTALILCLLAERALQSYP